jgi:single-stranded-DNA-specific exonuclease
MRWIEPSPIDVSPALYDAVGGHPLVAETLARRGILTPAQVRAFLDPDAYQPAPPSDLPDLEKACDRLALAVRRRERIAVWGDFDVDGQTATSLLLETLQQIGADVVFHIPTRQEGHGLHTDGLTALVAEGARLLITCDTGITAHAAVGQAHSLGIDVIITDHHPLEERLPAALSVINPHRLSPDHPLSHLAGVGVAYQLARAFAPAQASRALDLVALGTVADVAPLLGDVRYLVQRGLQRLRTTQRPGLQALFQTANLKPEGLSEEHISFALAPRLNALGRLAEAVAGVELLTTDDRARARILATEAEGLHAQRQWLTRQVMVAALAQIERDRSLLTDHHVLLLSHPTWPSSVTGIVAGRLAERFSKAVALISAPPGELARGSARSVPGIDLVVALAECRSLLASWGGHSAAAGFGLEADRISELRGALSRAIARQTAAVHPSAWAPVPTLQVEAYVPLSDLTLEFAAELNRLAPFGPGNRPVTLAVRDLWLLSETRIGRAAEHRRLTVEDASGHTATLFWWHGAAWPLPRDRFDLAVVIRTDDYRGIRELQVEWVDARERESLAAEVMGSSPVTILDYRAASDPEASLRLLAARSDLQIWAEGDAPAGLAVRTRHQLVPGRRLALWTLPPGPVELQAALSIVQPQEIILFAHDPGVDDPSVFRQRLAGLVKYTFRTKQGLLQVEEAAAAIAHRASAVRAGLEWLVARGQIIVVSTGDAGWQIVPGSGGPVSEAQAFAVRLDDLLAETAAYRAYLQDMPATMLSRHLPYAPSASTPVVTMS